ncbi:MAG: hypothetical protein HY711_01165 [Candidatus Melainabacteria bacterium]|nr:hypothetical protein [Candidatus Melainabacteria bacterium]
MQMCFKVHSGWLANELALAIRLQMLLTGRQCYEPSFQDDQWQLDAGNDWFMKVVEQTVELRYRYWEARTQEQWNALKTTIEMLLS